ncbi:hypothetical protein [Saccharopolyspora thermophila]|nr:hypothetical protein [Saccharopolyspora subtropica]
MPIKSTDSPEHAHFDAIYKFIAQEVRGFGYQPVRGDKINQPGNINKETVKYLAEADLVIADLTDLNPNVFYELGVRHALRRSGTVLLIDESRTEAVPFDLGYYRVLSYRSGSPEDIVQLTEQLRVTLQEIGPADEPVEFPPSHSPVHDWYPELPPDLLAKARSASDADLRRELEQARKDLERYRRREKQDSTGIDLADTDVRDLVRQLRQAAQNRALPEHIMRDADEAAAARNSADFLAAVEALLTSSHFIAPRDFQKLAGLALSLGLEAVTEGLLAEGLARFPTDKDMLQALVQRRSRSRDANTRKQAKKQLAAWAGIDLETAELLPGFDADKAVNDIGFLAEILYRENETEHGMKILESARQRDERGVLLPLYARQLGWLGQAKEAINAYREALRNPTPNQECIRWFANELHNHGYHVEAAEVYLLEAFFDVDDANGFVDFSSEVSFHMYGYYALKSIPKGSVLDTGPRDLPPKITRRHIREGLEMGISCNDIDADNIDVIERTLQRADLDLNLSQENVGRYTKDERIAWLRDTYSLVRSDLTAELPIAVRLVSGPLIPADDD